MAKVVDITEKLSFDENPVIRVKGEDLEVQADAENMLRILGAFGSGKTEIQAAMEAVKMLFNERDRKKINKLKLNIKDYMELIRNSINIAVGEEDSLGEQ